MSYILIVIVLFNLLQIHKHYSLICNFLLLADEQWRREHTTLFLLKKEVVYLLTSMKMNIPLLKKARKFKCKARKCNTFAFIKQSDQLLSLSIEHDHGSLLQITKSILKTHKRLAASNPDISTRNVLSNITAEVNNTYNGSVNLLPKKENIMRQIRYAKHKKETRPKVPISTEEVHKLMTDKYKTTCNNSQFLVN